MLPYSASRPPAVETIVASEYSPSYVRKSSYALAVTRGSSHSPPVQRSVRSRRSPSTYAPSSKSSFGEASRDAEGKIATSRSGNTESKSRRNVNFTVLTVGTVQIGNFDLEETGRFEGSSLERRPVFSTDNDRSWGLAVWFPPPHPSISGANEREI